MYTRNMVLLWRAEDPNQQAGPSTAKMDGSLSSDVKKFFFFFENVAMRGKSDEEKALELLAHLEGEAFDFYYETFAKDGALTEEAMNYALVKKAFFDRFGVKTEPSDDIRSAINAVLDPEDLLGSLKTMDHLFEKASFNGEAKFGLLRNALSRFPELAQFAIYHGATYFSDLKKVGA